MTLTATAKPKTKADPFHLIQTAEWWGAELQVDKLVFDRHKFTLGGEFRDDFNQKEHTYDQATDTVSPDINRSRRSYGVYFQGDLALPGNLHLNSGVRYDQYGDFQGTAHPRLALIHQPKNPAIFMNRNSRARNPAASAVSRK